MSKPSSLQVQAQRLVREISSLLDHYTDDNSLPKFYPPKPISQSCFGMAGAFASLIYTPSLPVTEIEFSNATTFYYLTILYGFQLYLKEFSLTYDGKPYSFLTNEKQIEAAREKIFTLASNKEMASTDLADEVIQVYTIHVKNRFNIEDYYMGIYEFNRDKFFDFIPITFLWGYNFAKEVIK